VPHYDPHYDQCYDVRRATGHTFPAPSEDETEKYIRIGTIESHYSTYYRITPKKYFCGGSDFALNWADTDRKRDTHHRYSPKGTVGHYLGVSFDAAMDEMLYYSNGSIDSSQYLLLVVECYFTNILYLADYDVLMAVCDKIDVEYDDPLDLMNAILNPRTANDLTDRIGLWARQRGFDGLVYPTARFSQQQDLQRFVDAGQPVYPMINRTSISCPLDMLWSLETGSYWLGTRRHGAEHPDDWHLIYADLNIVLFSGKQLRGNDRAVFWQVCPLELSDLLVSLDHRPSMESAILYWDKNGKNLHPKPGVGKETCKNVIRDALGGIFVRNRPQFFALLLRKISE
jgi:hypothetical protein